MEGTITVLRTAFCGQQGSCEIDKVQAGLVSAQMGMECRHSNVGLGLMIDLGRHSPFGISWFEPSSTMKVELYRGFKDINLFNDLVGQHEGKVVDLLENSEYIVRYIHAFMLKTI